MDFQDTVMGHRYYERDLPALIKAMQTIPDLVESINKLERTTKRLAELQEEANLKIMTLNDNLPNEACIGKSVTCCPADYDETENGGYYDVKDPQHGIVYMIGEPVEIVSFDETNATVTMKNENNDIESELFTISYAQYLKDFGIKWN